MEEELPVMTIVLSVLILASFIFTTNLGERIFNPSAKSDLVYYEYLLGFIPARPTIYSLITYTFIHSSFGHLIGNLVVLIMTGWVLEKYVGKVSFLAIYIASGCTAAVFDILSRILLGVQMSIPFVGASGSIFGLVAVAALSKPTEKIPTFLVLLIVLQILIGLPIFAGHEILLLSLAVVAVIQYLMPQFALSAMVLIIVLLVISSFTSVPATILTIIIFSVAVTSIVLYLLPRQVPFFVGALFFIFSWIVLLALNPLMSTSNIGHLGGLVGGFICMFIFSREEKKS